MNFETLPRTYDGLKSWGWEQFAPFYDELTTREFSSETVGQWILDWSTLSDCTNELFARRYVANVQDTTDAEAEAAINAIFEQIQPKAEAAEQRLKERLLESGLEPAGFEIPLRNMRAAAALFNEANLPLQTAASKLGMEYNKIQGGMQFEVDGEMLTPHQLNFRMQSATREERERLWKISITRDAEERAAINDIWVRLFENRSQQAKNAGFDNFRDLAWQRRRRFEYTPKDCETFQHAIETVVVPAAARIYAQYAKENKIEALRPWDLTAGTFLVDQSDLRPVEEMADLDRIAESIFQKIDPALGDYFSMMRNESLLDLENRKGKGPGGFCITFPVSKRPFIFMNAVGAAGDVRTMLHEAGHAFHAFEKVKIPTAFQRSAPMEFNEVASMAMELLASPYLSRSEGGYFEEADAAQYRIEHLKKIILFWPYMAVVDAFQHWAYTHGDAALDPAACDAKWTALWQRFVPAADYTGFEATRATGWHRKLHIFRAPFYYVEYGLAQLGAVQIWRNARQDRAQAISDYLAALRLGGTRSIPELFAAAGGRFAFDVATLQEAVDLIESTVEGLEAKLA